jgi:hypothetical protein
MLPKKFIDFHNIHKNEKIVVCGCGMSLLDFEPYINDFITIGTNDVPSLFNPTYNLVTDHPNRFNDKRKKWINESDYKYLFTCVGGWRHPNIVKFDLGKKGAANLADPSKVDHFLNSPYTAINIAYKLGAKAIGFIGVDFTNGHFYSKKDGQHSLDRMGYLKDLKWGYRHIKDELAKHNVALYNLSAQSKIDTVPHMSIDNFKAL